MPYCPPYVPPVLDVNSFVGEIYAYLYISTGAFLTITGVLSGAHPFTNKMVQITNSHFLIAFIHYNTFNLQSPKFSNYEEAWNCKPHSYLKVVGNLGYRCNNSSPRYSVRTTMPSLYPN